MAAEPQLTEAGPSEARLSGALQPAIALIECDSVAAGILAGDAMVKRAPVRITRAGTVHPGRYLILVGGDEASVEEAFEAGLATGAASVVDSLLLPGVDPVVVAALGGVHRRFPAEALGVVETRTVAAILGAADRGVKGAEVALVELRLADDLGGKSYCMFSGTVADVEAAVELAVGGLADPGQLVARVVIPQLHEEMQANLEAAPEFRQRLAAAPDPRSSGA
jgi:microcompartment protein CcmL/EutN